MITKVEKIQKAIEAIKKDRPEYVQMLDLFGKIMIKQAEFLDKVKVDFVKIAEMDARSKLKNGTPLLNRKDFHIDLSSASLLFEEIIRIIKSEGHELTDELGKIEEALENGDLPIEEILQSVLTDSSRVSRIAEELSLDDGALFMLATISIRPSIEANAAQIQGIVEDATWSKHYCPVCGSSPAISELRKLEPTGSIEGATSEGAERILHCSFCGTQWRSMRLGCLFCDNSDQEFMEYLYTEEEKGYRIDVCKKCRKYIKTVDTREISHEIVPPLEDVATMHLDIIAEEEGYKREAWFMPYGI